MCNSIPKNSDDPFCENLFWKSQNVKTTLHDPVCSITGIFIAVFPILFENISKDCSECDSIFDIHSLVMFYAIKGFVVTIGIGTFYYHAFSHEYSCQNLWINDHTVDWTSLVLLLLILTLFYFYILTKRCWSWIHELQGQEAFFTLWTSTLGVWALILIAAMDSHTENQWRNHLNPNHSPLNFNTTNVESGTDTYGTVLNIIFLVYPIIIFVLSITFKIKYEELKKLAVLVILTIVFYILNTNVCSTILWFFIFHALYHFIAMVMILHIACIGMRILHENQLQIDFRYYIWPVIFPCKYIPVENKRWWLIANL